MRRQFRMPLARYGFTVCAVIAFLTDQPAPFLVSAALAAYAWRIRPRRRR
ncbi:MAG TPA: hypothetical protein VGA42_08495 [Gemmatimonadales bacterium]